VVRGGKPVLVLALAHIHHPFHSAAIDYLGLAAACFASWSFFYGPGEPVLIAEAIFAAQHDLSIVSVLAVAWASAAAGGIAGWLVGRSLGHAVVVAPGPLRRFRVRAVEQNEAIFGRHPILAIYLAPSWVAGVARVGTVLYLVVNAVTAIIWAVTIGLGAYYAGPPIVDLVGDMGVASGIALGVLVVSSIGGELLRRWMRRRRAEAS
jgi:membrane protein DedA with SNARE-associated domain